MRIYSLIFVILAGCQNTPQGESDFYTWVDETGQIRTIKKQPKQITHTAEPNTSINENSVSKGKQNKFDTADFIPEEEIQKKLNDQKMFAWQDSAGTQIVREESIVKAPEADKSIVSNAIEEVSFNVYREGKQVLFDDLDGSVFDLSRYYHFNKQSQSDYVLFELSEPVKKIQLKTFIHTKSVAMPQIIPLTARFKQVFSFENPYQYREKESWYGYGHLHGVLNIPRNTQYLLLIPSSESGVIEAEGDIIRQSNLGSIVLTSLD